MSYVLRQIHPPGKSARADEATAVALMETLPDGGPVRGKYLVSSDPDARGGRGDDRWSDNLAEAKRFPSFEAAMACWMTQSTVLPLRPDGRPNRPLTAYSVTVEHVEDE